MHATSCVTLSLSVILMATKAAFVSPWSDSPDQHLSAYARDLTRRQYNAKKYDVKITDNNKVTEFVACIYKSDILEDAVMEKWEENGDRNWANTVKHFVKEYSVVTRAAERAVQHAGFESAAAFREKNRPRLPLKNTPLTAVPGPYTEDYDAITV